MRQPIAWFIKSLYAFKVIISCTRHGSYWSKIWTVLLLKHSTQNHSKRIATERSDLEPYLKELIPILEFLNKNLNDRHYKQPNLYLWSHKPDTGKSSLFNLLAELTPNYHWPLDLWYESYSNFTYQTIVWDEFSLRGQNPEFIKLLLAGTQMQLQKKGSQVVKTR